MLLLEQFENLTLHPKNAARLKELVLQLAVQGKLTENWRRQNPKVEPAAELLKRIEAEKAQLVREGKMKKEKPLEPILEEEVPYELPEGWVWCRIGAISNYGSSEKVEPIQVTENLWVLELEDVEKGTSRLIQKVRFEERKFQSTKSKFYKGDIIYGKLRPYLDKVIVADEDGVCTTEMIPFRGYGNLKSEFIRLTLKTPAFIKYANDSTHGMNLPRLGTEKAREALLPLPPLSEQEAIVARVEELMHKIEELEKQTAERIQLKKHLAAAALHQLTAAADEDLHQHWLFLKQHFQTIFDEKENVKKLRETILQLAVQGKLTAAWRRQNPATEPASELLKRIQAEKAQLVKEKKIKKEKPMEPILEEEIAVDIPESWKWVRLGELGDWGAGATPSRGNSELYGGDINWFKSGELNNGIIEHTSEESITSLALKKTSLRLNKPGDVLIAMYGATIGKTAILAVEGTT